MSLNDDERKTMVSLQMEKANRFMNQAEMVSQMQQWDLAANRYYAQGDRNFVHCPNSATTRQCCHSEDRRQECESGSEVKQLLWHEVSDTLDDV